MQRVRSANNVALGNAGVTPGAQNPGYFTSGNPAGSVPATVVPDYWLNMVQEELMALLTAAGITPSDVEANWNQVLQALMTLPGKNWSVFSSPGTVNWIVPSSVTIVDAEVWGAGAGGGGASSTTAPGGTGGGAGGYARGFVSGLTAGASIAVTVGSGGAGGAAGGGTGGNGGTSSFGSYLSATGGTGGAGNGSSGGTGGTGTGGNLHLPGNSGSFSIGVTGGTLGGFGGSTVLFGAPNLNVNSLGSFAGLPGAGGNGASANAAGGKGGNGLVILRW